MRKQLVAIAFASGIATFTTMWLDARDEQHRLDELAAQAQQNVPPGEPEDGPEQWGCPLAADSLDKEVLDQCKWDI